MRLQTLIIGKVAFTLGTVWTSEHLRDVDRIIDITLEAQHQATLKAMED